MRLYFYKFVGDVQSMRHLKDEVDQIKKDVECGIQLADKSFEPEVGDQIHCYTLKSEKGETDWKPGF